MSTTTAPRGPRPLPPRPRIARPIESFLADHPPPRPRACDVLVVGSGYGGSFAALELAADHRSVWVFERGREFGPGAFAETLGELPGHVQFTSGASGVPRGYRDALFDIRVDDDAVALVGCGLGGGSLINAGVFLEPRDAVLDDPRWPRAVREDRTGLRAAYGWARTVIGVAPFERPERFPKYVALRRLARAIPNAGISAAPIAVTAHDGVNAVGVPRRACIECGNCVTGCNHEAKNTLPANAIPLAAERGARFWTGARAVRITRARPGSRIPGSSAPARWSVHFERIATLGPGRDAPDTFEVLANVVVLAAGALGSAELLLRSASDDLPMPATLGARFSGNGDLLSFGWGQRTPVHAAARPGDGTDDASAPGPGDRPRVGPTIVGVIATRGDDSMPGSLPRDAVLQEGAVPAGLAPMIGTLLSAAGTVQSMTHPGVPSQRAWARGGDPIAVRDDLADRCQVLLAMGRDRADGRLGLDAPDAAGRRRFRFGLGYARDDETIAGIEAALEHAGAKNGFDGGFHLPNPAWRPLPAAAEAIFGKVDGRLVTVHPIGGCVMGDDRAAGAVDDLGRVYDPAAADPRAVHDGLHVLDGAILPTALGVNPMATIAAVSIRASRRIAATLDAEAAARPDAAPQAGPWPVRLRPAGPPTATDEAIAVAAAPAVRTPPPPARLRFAEALLTEPCMPVPVTGMEALLDAVQPPLAGGTAAALARGDARLALQVTAQIDPWRWVADPARPWTGEAVLSVVDARGAPPDGIERIVGRGTCALHLLRADPPANMLALASRMIGSALAFNARRPGTGFFGQLWNRFCELGAVAVHDDLKVFLRTLRMHTTHRTLDYSATLQTGDGGTLTLAGGKRLAYTGDERNVWDALLRIDLTPSHGGRTGASWPMRVDLLELLSRGPYQLLSTPDTPTAVAAMSAVGALWLRALVQTHYWSFRGPDDTAPDLRPPSGKALSTLTLLDGTTVAPVEHWFDVRRTETSPERLRLRLSRFRATRRTRRGAMLFVHGLAHGGEVYTTSSVERPMAARFVEDGWDVWVLDHRLSNLLGPTPRLASTIDDVATCDLPGAFDAVESVLAAEGTPADEGLRVFAHCVGAAALSIAILSGRLTRQDRRSRISGLVMHAVHPWTVPSRWNRVSASLGAFYRDVVGDEVLDPLPGSPPGPMDQVIDRLAASIPWSGSAQQTHLEDAARRGQDPAHHEHYGDLICNRMTLFYGREWDHDNLDPRTHARLHELVGPAHISVFKHLFYILRRQRLTDAQGRNAYLSQAALDRHWTFPTLFATGMANGVFDPASAARSFLAMSLLRRTAPGIGRCGLFLPPGIGHMDFLFGRHNGEPPPTAGKTSLPGAGLQSTLSDFVADPSGWLARREAPPQGAEDRRRAVALSPQLEVEATPWVGPLLRYTLGPAHFELEAWIELRPFRSARVEPGANSVWKHKRLGPGLPGDFRRLSWSCPLGPDAPPPEIPHPYVDTGVDLDPNGELPAFRAAGAAPDLIELSSAYMRRRVDIPDTWSAAPWLRHLFALRAAGEAPRAMTFLLGSCRWPGLVFERDAAAAPIAAMNARVARAAHEAHEAHEAPTIDGLLLLGDQVYVDATADLFDTGIPEERASQRYREAFSGESLADERLPSPEMARLLSSLPSWMVVDDHEFGDDWPGWSPGVALSPRFREGFDAALAYQWRGLDAGMAATADAPASAASAPIASPGLGLDRVTRGLWHPFEAATLRCFALDTRTERQRRSAADWQTARIMHAAQLAALAGWLRTRTSGDASAPRLLLCGSPLGLPRADELDAAAPNALRADDWHGYPASCRELLQAVLEGDGAPVVLLCGDPHYSCVVELEVEGTVDGLPRRARLHLVVASGLNTSLPFANGNPRELARGRVRLPFSDATLTAHARLLGGVATTPRHFTQLGVRCDAPGQWSLEVEQVDERGATITRQAVTLGEACAEVVA